MKKNCNKFVLMSAPAQKYKNNPIFNQNYALTLFISFENGLFLLFLFKRKSRFCRFPPAKKVL